MVNTTPRPPNPDKDPVPIVQDAVWAPRSVWAGAENLVPTGIRSLDRPASSESLYRLSYPGPYLKVKPEVKYTVVAVRRVHAEH